MTDAGKERLHLTIVDAAAAAGVHRRVIRRLLDAGKFPNAYRLDGSRGQRTWSIPVEDLVAAGFDVNEPRNLSDTAARAEQSELERLREELAAERAGRRLAEAVAEDRARALVTTDALAEERARALERAEAEISALRSVAARRNKNGTSATPGAGRRWWKR